jgi:hypothetical protein
MRRTFIIAAGLAALPIFSGSAWAQANRTFVSGHGSDTNPCSLSAPCRSFQQAHDLTNAGGEITVLDSAGYGSVTITKSITITNPGGSEAGITTTSGETAITINTPAAANITLRGLTLEGGGVGTNGILLNSSLPNGPGSLGGALNIIDCVVKDFTVDGIDLVPTNAGSGTINRMNIVIANTFSLNNGAAGIALSPTSINPQASIYQTVLSGNSTGVLISDNTGRTVSALFVDSHADGNGSNGISLNNTVMIMKNSTAVFNRSTDIVNNFGIVLYNNNTIDIITNSGSANTDGTNNISEVNGNALTKVNPQ